MAAGSTAPRARPRLRQRLPAVIGLLLLSPIAAEYLIGYLESIARPLEMLAGLLIFAPLYGAPAVLIREVTRRAGRGWPTILLLGAAFGLAQAGLIDQSMFNPDYSSAGDDVPYWDESRSPTLIAALGISADQTLTFVGGHMIWSFAAPIAVVEACAPRIAGRPWLGRPGIALMMLLYGAAATLILGDRGGNETFVASPAQLGVAAGVTVALAGAAFLIPRRRTGLPGWLPAPWQVGLASLTVFTIYQLTPSTWAGFAADVVALAALGAFLLYGSARAGWGRRHTLLAGGAALLVNAAMSFLVQPLGNPDMTMKYASNAVFTVGVLALAGWAFLRVRRTEATPALPCPQPGETLQEKGSP